MLFNIMGVGLEMNDRGKKFPVIQRRSDDNSTYRFVAPSAVSLKVGVILPIHVALVADIDGVNLLHESDALAPEVLGGTPTYFLAGEYDPDHFIWLQNARWNTGSLFGMQGYGATLTLRFYLPTQLPGLPEEGKTWMGGKWKSEEERWMEERSMSGMSGLRVGPFEPRPIPPQLRPGYFSTTPFLVVVVEFIPLDEFNELAAQNGIPEWDPYAEE